MSVPLPLPVYMSRKGPGSASFSAVVVIDLGQLPHVEVLQSPFLEGSESIQSRLYSSNPVLGTLFATCKNLLRHLSLL